MVAEPRPTMFGQERNYHYAQSNAYNGRWRLWYSSIADWMIEHPGGKVTDCAAALNKNYGTILRITQSDGFQDYFAKRRQEFVRDHDERIKRKLSGVASSALDIILAELEKKKDQTPLSLALKVAESSLDRLGFGPQQPANQTVVNVNSPQDNRQVVLNGVSAQALEEARSALRLAEQKRSLEPSPPIANLQRQQPAAEGEAGPLVDEEEVIGDPPSLD